MHMGDQSKEQTTRERQRECAATPACGRKKMENEAIIDCAAQTLKGSDWFRKYIRESMDFLTYAIPAAVGVLGWFGAHVIGKRFLEIREKRLEALRAVAMYGFVGTNAGEERVRTANATLSELGAALVAYAHERSWAARICCSLLRYDLLMAGSALSGLASMADDDRYRDETRENNANLVYLSLRAETYVPVEKLDRLKRELKERDRIKFINK